MQRELLRNMAVEVAYSGSYADRVGRTIQEQSTSRSSTTAASPTSASDGADAAAAAGAESVQHRQLRVAGDDQPGALSAAGGQLVLHRGDGQRQNLLRGYPQLSGTDLHQPAARRGQGSRARDNGQPPLRGWPQRQPGVRGARRHRKPDGRSLRSRADAVADEPERPAVAPQRRRGLRVAVRQHQAVPEHGAWPPKILGGWQTGGHVRVPARRAARLGQPVLQRRPRQTSRRTIRRSRCSATARSTSPRPGSTSTRASRGRRPPAGGVPEARLPVPHRRRARPVDVPGEREHRAELRSGGRRRLQFRMDVQNLFDSVQWGNPNLDPTSTNFGRITTATNSIMRFFTFVARYSF